MLEVVQQALEKAGVGILMAYGSSWAGEYFVLYALSRTLLTFPLLPSHPYKIRVLLLVRRFQTGLRE